MTAATATRKPLCDPGEVARALRLILEPGQVTELRALDASIAGGDHWPAVHSGYFDDPQKLVKELQRLRTAKGIYVTPNPCNPALLSRAANRLRKAPKGESVSDLDIVSRRWLLIDVDARRPSGISASDAEHEAALELARKISANLRFTHNWPDPILADSGNGAHLMYRIDLPADDGGLVQRCLAALAAEYSTSEVCVDTSVFNAARIWKLYGSMSGKGDDTPERPHRSAGILSARDALELVSQELLEALAVGAPCAEPTRQKHHEGNGQPYDLVGFIRRHNLDVDGPHPWNGKQGAGQRWTFRRSPMCDHHEGAAHIEQHGSGAVSAACHHQSCTWKWADLRERFEPKATRHAKASTSSNGQAAAVESTGKLHLTDVGNAERLVHRHGQDLRYCHPWGKWLCWDGRRWKLDDVGAVTRLAKDTARSVWQEAADCPDDDRRKALAKHAAASEKRDRLSAMMALAQSEFGIPILPTEMDVDPWALNVLNGTIDLRSGGLRAHRREDLLTKLCPVEYLPAVECEPYRWQEFLFEIFEGNGAIINYVQRVTGSSLVGMVHEHILPLFWGKGRNGKTTFLEAIRSTLGPEYSIAAPVSLLMQKNVEAHPTELATLFGMRIVTCIESQEGARLDASQVKMLTGGDTICARRMREDFWQFVPSHTVFLGTNHKPLVKDTSDAIWARVKLVPFKRKFVGDAADRDLPSKLKDEASGILAWCVQGCLQWQREGLGEPDAIQEATAGYRAEQDVLGAFLAECCIEGPAYTVRAAVLYDMYKRWCDQTGEYQHNQTRFGLAMAERGFEKEKVGTYYYLGLGLLTDDAR